MKVARLADHADVILSFPIGRVHQHVDAVLLPQLCLAVLALVLGAHCSSSFVDHVGFVHAQPRHLAEHYGPLLPAVPAVLFAHGRKNVHGVEDALRQQRGVRVGVNWVLRVEPFLHLFQRVRGVKGELLDRRVGDARHGPFFPLRRGGVKVALVARVEGLQVLQVAMLELVRVGKPLAPAKLFPRLGVAVPRPLVLRGVEQELAVRRNKGSRSLLHVKVRAVVVRGARNRGARFRLLVVVPVPLLALALALPIAVGAERVRAARRCQVVGRSREAPVLHCDVLLERAAPGHSVRLAIEVDGRAVEQLVDRIGAADDLGLRVHGKQRGGDAHGQPVKCGIRVLQREPKLVLGIVLAALDQRLRLVAHVEGPPTDVVRHGVDTTVHLSNVQRQVLRVDADQLPLLLDVVQLRLVLGLLIGPLWGHAGPWHALRLPLGAVKLVLDVCNRDLLIRSNAVLDVGAHLDCVRDHEHHERGLARARRGGAHERRHWRVGVVLLRQHQLLRGVRIRVDLRGGRVVLVVPVIVHVVGHVRLPDDATRNASLRVALVEVVVRVLHVEQLGAVLLVQRSHAHVGVQALGLVNAPAVLEHVGHVVHQRVHLEGRGHRQDLIAPHHAQRAQVHHDEAPHKDAVDVVLPVLGLVRFERFASQHVKLFKRPRIRPCDVKVR